MGQRKFARYFGKNAKLTLRQALTQLCIMNNRSTRLDAAWGLNAFGQCSKRDADLLLSICSIRSTKGVRLRDLAQALDYWRKEDYAWATYYAFLAAPYIPDYFLNP